MKTLVVSWLEEQQLLCDIRRKVFIDEQHVSETEEWDQQDELSSTAHLLAYVDDVAVGTARLLNSGKIGRVAVLKEFRKRGIGKQLIQTAIQTALHENMSNIYLDAQLQVTKLYRTFGFETEGEPFMDAGIEHIRMTLQLSQLNLSTIYKTDNLGRENQLISSVKQASQHTLQQCQYAKKHIHVFTDQLRPELWASAELVDAISKLARKSRHSRIRILIKDAKLTRGRSHALVELAQRLSSSIEIRVLRQTSRETQTEGTEHSYVICDNTHMVYFKDENKTLAHANYNAAAEIKQLMHNFEYLWENHSEADPNLRRLCL